MGKGYPNERFMRNVLDEAEHRIRQRAGQSYGLSVDVETGILSAVRTDGYHAAYKVGPRSTLLSRLEDQVCGCVPLPADLRDKLWFKGQVGKIVDGVVMAAKLEAQLSEPEPDGEPELAVQPEDETESRFAVAIVFGSRPDIVLTPARGVPVDEAVRVYQSFLAGAAAIGGRPAMLPLGA